MSNVSRLVISVVAVGAAAAAVVFGGQETEGPIVVTGDLTLGKGAVLTRGLRIAASHITIDGNGAVLQGPGKAGDPKSFEGTGVLAEGVSGVTLRNVTARGFENGIVAKDGEGWKIERCDFSGNYHDPEFGWGDGKPAGGMLLTRISRSVIRDCKAKDVWNGLYLTECRENLIQGNDFSHASNTCLKLWTSCRNTCIGNNLSYGIRIRPGEVHARDSTGVLIESGSDDNVFHGNDITHGGDGVFVRALNGWVSTGNLFVEVPFNEARWSWSLVEVPLKGDKDWTVESTGSVSLERIDALSISIDSWGNDPFTIWIDGLSFNS